MIQNGSSSAGPSEGVTNIAPTYRSRNVYKTSSTFQCSRPSLRSERLGARGTWNKSEKTFSRHETPNSVAENTEKRYEEIPE